jgi:hypothetical protein
MKRLTREWISKAEDDYQAARRLGDERGRFHDQVCFHCQQAAEKYLKGLLQERGAPSIELTTWRDRLMIDCLQMLDASNSDLVLPELPGEVLDEMLHGCGARKGEVKPAGTAFAGTESGTGNNVGMV